MSLYPQRFSHIWILPGGGVCGVIFKKKMQAACNKNGFCCFFCEAVKTNGFKPKAEYVIHTVRPIDKLQRDKIVSYMKKKQK